MCVCVAAGVSVLSTVIVKRVVTPELHTHVGGTHAGLRRSEKGARNAIKHAQRVVSIKCTDAVGPFTVSRRTLRLYLHLLYDKSLESIGSRWSV